MNDIELIDEIVRRAEEHQKQREKEFAIAELEEIKKEIKKQYSFYTDYGVICGCKSSCEIIDKHIAELKGE